MVASREEPMHKPARPRGFAAIEAFAIEPEAAPDLVLDEIIVARRLRLVPAPPFAGDALRPLRQGDAMGDAAPAEAPWRALGNERRDLGGLGASQHQQRARPRRVGFRPG